MKRRKPAAERKTIEIRFRAAAVDVERLTALSAKLEAPPSAIMRRLIREEANRANIKIAS